MGVNGAGGAVMLPSQHRVVQAACKGGRTVRVYVKRKKKKKKSVHMQQRTN